MMDDGSAGAGGSKRGMYLLDSSLDDEKEMHFEPLGRLRANTWPASRFAGQSDAGDDNDIGAGGAGGSQSLTPDAAIDSGRSSRHAETDDMTGAAGGSHDATQLTFGPALGQAKKNSSRRNAWGNMSYADLITQAIDSSAEKRLTLSQIYDWMVQNVPYFKDKGDSNSSAGWKNSIRHNLSLHNRFKREQNEGTGKSSWWTINPDAKPGKSTRRRAASMETQKYEKRRGRVRKQLEERRRLGSDAGGVAVGRPSPSSPINEAGEYAPPSDNASSSPLHNPLLHSLQEPFRSRTNSNASSYGRLSPVPGGTFDDGPALSPHSWTHESSSYGGGARGHQGIDDHFQPQLAELDVQLTHSMQLHDSGGQLMDKANGGTSSRSGPFLHNSTGYHWNKPASTFVNSGLQQSIRPGQQSSNQVPCKQQLQLDPFAANKTQQEHSTVMNAHIFSGGSFSHIPEESKNSNKTPRMTVPEVHSPVQSHQRLPSICRSQFSDSDLLANHQQLFGGTQMRLPLLANSTANAQPQMTNNGGSFPADLDLFMDSVQPGFAGVDVDAVLNYEMTVGGNLLDVNFDSCLNASQQGGSGSSSSSSSASPASKQHANATSNLHPWL